MVHPRQDPPATVLPEPESNLEDFVIVPRIGASVIGPVLSSHRRHGPL